MGHSIKGEHNGPSGLGLDARLTIMLCKKIVTKSKKVKTG
jgi:hypothetical protein